MCASERGQAVDECAAQPRNPAVLRMVLLRTNARPMQDQCAGGFTRQRIRETLPTYYSGVEHDPHRVGNQEQAIELWQHSPVIGTE